VEGLAGVRADGSDRLVTVETKAQQLLPACPTMIRNLMTEFKLPVYAKITAILFGLSLAFLILTVGRDVLVPLAYASLLSVLLYPLADLLERHGFHHLVSITIALALACIVVACLVVFIGMQIGQFEEDLPRLKTAGLEYFGKLQSFVRETWGIAYKDQLEWIRKGASQAMEGGGFIGKTFLTFVDIATLVVLVPLYAFLMLLYRDLLVEFTYRLFPKNKSGTVKDILNEARIVVKSYTFGLMMETAIVAVLNSVALLLLGIDYAILFGIIAAILNLIPYIGILIGATLPCAMALITHESAWYPIGVVLAFVVIQFVDNNFIVPYVVASRVSVNALVSIVAVIVGGIAWGISGMFLALPAVAILKVLFDRIEPLKAWGLLLGDQHPSLRSGKKSGALPS